MKTRHYSLLLALAFLADARMAMAQGTAFTYQGRLDNEGVPVSGAFDFEFKLYNASSGGTQLGSTQSATDTTVSNGLFTVDLDFGAPALSGGSVWLQIEVRTNGGGSYNTLNPLQEITPTPFAVNAESAQNFTGTLTAAQLPTGVVTNKETSVSLGTVVLSGELVLDSPTLYYVGSGFLGGISTNVLIQMPGSDNLFMGLYTGNANISGENNVGVGLLTLLGDTTASDNTAMGFEALASSSTGGGNSAFGTSTLEQNTNGYNNTALGYDVLPVNPNGHDNVGVGCATLQALTSGSINTGIGTYAFQHLTAGQGNVGFGYNAGYNLTTGTNNIYIANEGNSSETGVIRIGTPGTHTATYLAGTVNVPVITITGGADLAEPFQISAQDGAAAPGAVVVIDENNPGHLRVSDEPYDPHVAGVISGANGIHPGIQMHQEGALEGGQDVALSGRVYVEADATFGAIRPGDLLTTSSTPGHAMRVSDHARAQGAILGKAMTGLASGKGKVLTLVTLQ